MQKHNLLRKMSFMLRTNLATRRTFVRLRANKNKSEALFLLGLSVLHLFFYPLKRGCKKTFVFLQPLLFLSKFYIFIFFIIENIISVFVESKSIVCGFACFFIKPYNINCFAIFGSGGCSRCNKNIFS